MTLAFELDCSSILGDNSYFVPQSLFRVSRFSTENSPNALAKHDKYGYRLSDVVKLGDRTVKMTLLESAAIDSMMDMKTIKKTTPVDGVTELAETPDENYVPKLSSWITRHIAIFQSEPSEKTRQHDGQCDR